MKNNQFHPDVLSTSVDTACLLFLRVLFVLTLIFAHKVSDWQSLSLQFASAGILYLTVVWMTRRMPEGFLSVALHVVAVLGLFQFLFGAIADLQHIVIDGWMDDVLISTEHSLIGTESSLFLQQFVNPVLTEWMMFAYVMYVPFLPLVALICYWSSGTRAAKDYLLNLSLANIVCYIGFVVFPVASPLYHWPQMYTVPLEGGFFTWCGEWIRQTQHYAGGSLPSPHCAAGTVMLAMLYRYNRTLFYVGLPTFLTLYVSTVYGRYHFAWDGVAGIVTALLVVKFSPKLIGATEVVRTWYRRLSEPRMVPESLTE